MRTRISKHGKYEIMEGSYVEMKDLLQPGDILRTLDDVPEGMKQSDFDVQLVSRISSEEVMDRVLEDLTLPAKLTAYLAMADSPTEGFAYSWKCQNLKNKMVFVWFGEHDDTPCRIKRRRITEDTTEDSNVHVGPITGKHVNTDSGEKPAHDGMPNKPGLWKDKDGYNWVAIERSGELEIFLIGRHDHGWPSGSVAKYVPFYEIEPTDAIKEERVSSTVEYVEVYPDGHEVVHHNYPLRMVTRTWSDDEFTYELADTSNNAESKTLIMSGKGVPDIEDTLHFTIGTTMFPGVSKTTRADYCLTKIVHHVEHPDPPTTGLWLDRENNVVWFDYLHKYYTLIADSGCDYMNYMNGLDYTPKPPFKPLITATEIINKQDEA